MSTQPVLKDDVKDIDGTFTVDEFLAWAQDQPSGRYELYCGRIVPVAPGRNLHNLTKTEVLIALREAVKRAGLSCTVFNDGVTVRTAAGTAYEPDATVQCGVEVDLSSMTADRPVIIVEVLSPSTRGVDTGAKLISYFNVESIEHVLLVEPERRVVAHHRRDGADIATSIRVDDGDLRLDPPGLVLPISDLFLPSAQNASPAKPELGASNVDV